MRFVALISILLAFLPRLSSAAIVVDGSDPVFAQFVQNEVTAMREGKRGFVSQTLIGRLDVAFATTTIRALTQDESTWHPNDLKGTRSHVVPKDTLMRGAERRRPTDAVVYIHATRVDPSMSLYKLGTFAYQLATAADLNDGYFSSDYRVREKRASFYRNAWLDALGLKPLSVSDRVMTPEYAQAKADGLLDKGHADKFPFVDLGPMPVSTP